MHSRKLLVKTENKTLIFLQWTHMCKSIITSSCCDNIHMIYTPHGKVPSLPLSYKKHIEQKMYIYNDPSQYSTLTDSKDKVGAFWQNSRWSPADHIRQPFCFDCWSCKYGLSKNWSNKLEIRIEKPALRINVH